MARTPRDLALLLDTLAGPDPRDPHALPAHPSFAAGLAAGHRGRRIGWIGDWGGYYPIEPGILPLCEAALGASPSSAPTVEPVTPPFDPARLWSAWLTLRGFATAARRGPLAADPAKRARLKPEALWEVESAAGLAAAEVLGRQRRPLRMVRLQPPGCSSASTRWSCRAPRSSPSTPPGPGRARSPAAPWRPTTSGWRW